MKNILIKGAPGTGKTITARAMAYYLCHQRLNIDNIFLQDFISDKNDIEDFINSDSCEFIQIHPSMTYEDIVYGIDVHANNTLSMGYAEKRIKKLCDRAIGSTDLFCIILDDIGRANSGKLLGNLIYAMEYRNQPVKLADGKTLIIPNNVFFIITECNQAFGNILDYALRRRFDYVKELYSSSDILNQYYSNLPSISVKNIIDNVYSNIINFITGNFTSDSDAKVYDYMPGHGMFIVDRNDSDINILNNIKLKLIYQLFPYLEDMKNNGLITGDIKQLLDDINNIINTGMPSANNIISVTKKFIKSGDPIIFWSLNDSKDYYLNEIIPNDCKEHRAIIECIIDAMLLNEILPIDLAVSNILTNTDIVKFEHRHIHRKYVAFIAEKSDALNYNYQTKNSNNPRSYYSTNPVTKGRYLSYHDAPMYELMYENGTIKQYISLNAFRDSSKDITTTIIHASENTANIYPAAYLLTVSYLKTYENNIKILALTDTSYSDLAELAKLERMYFEQVSQASVSGTQKTKYLCERIANLRLLWGKKGDILNIDTNLFNELKSGQRPLTEDNYLNLYNITTTPTDIEIKGVNRMININDYQHIMESIGVRQMIFQGPPGTSKTFESKKFVLKNLNPSSPVLTTAMPSQEDISIALDEYKLTAADYENPSSSSKLVSGGWDLVQFHPSYGYEDFIRGIEVKPVNGSPVYSSVNRILGKIAEFAKLSEMSSGTNPPPKFYLIIDEINRANLASVFGELIYGLEYRNSPVSTPYEVNNIITNTVTKDIILGKNLYIIGTMNTADKSIDTIDYAIRRRFIFIDSPSDRNIVVKCYQNTMGVTDENSIEILLFDAVSSLFDDERFFNSEYQKSDVKLGHTYFIRNSSTGYKDTAIEHFIFQVIPILREYVKDGILDSVEDLKAMAHTVDDIIASDNKIKFLSENIMMFIMNFGETDSTGKLIDNNYISEFIDELCDRAGY